MIYMDEVSARRGATDILKMIQQRAIDPAAKPPISKSWPFPKGARFLFYRAVA